MNYDNLSPGLYLQRGDTIKRIGEIGDPLAAALTGHNYSDPERLASAVGWVFIALNKRASQIKELYQFGQWQTTGSGNEIDAPPFAFNIQREMLRIDYALQLLAQAYLFKQRRGRRLIGLRWLDPATVEPDPQTAEVIPGGVRYGRYWRTDPLTLRRDPIDATDIIHFMLPGLRELEPASPASKATKTAGNILLGIGEMFSTFYENNALPVMLVHVPAGTSPEDVQQIRSGFWRIFNPRRGSRENRTVGIREGVTVTPLSINPENLDAIPLEDSQIRQIVTAHDIPYEIVATSANYAVSQDRRRDFVGSIGQRMQEIADVINNDRDIALSGIEWTVDPEQHWAMKRDERDAATATLNWVQAGMTPQAAAYLMGITEKRFPAEIRAAGIWRPLTMGMPEMGSSPARMEDEAVVDGEAKSAELIQFRRWYKKRIGGDVDGFAAKHLTKGDKLIVADEMLRNSWEVYP